MLSRYKNVLVSCYRCLKLQHLNGINKPQGLICKLLTTEAESEALDVFHHAGPTTFDKVLPVEVKRPEKFVKKKISKPKAGDAIIECKRPELNHYRNQKYDKLSPIPLASKGWMHRKSRGDYFTINISRKDQNADDLFWREDGKSFEDLKLDPPIIQAANGVGAYKPTIIQEESIPIILAGKNTLLAAETGCGKTLAYLLPIVQQVVKWSKQFPERPPNTPLGMILCPNRELAFQIGKIAKLLSYQLPFRCNILVGGRTKQKMLNPDFQHIDLLIATPGALSKLTTLGLYNVGEVRHLVLDEADTLLDDSFNDKLVHFLKKFKLAYQNDPKEPLPSGCQLSLVSATRPTSIYTILDQFIEPDSLVKVKTDRLHRVLPHVPQKFYRLGHSEKAGKLLTIAKAAAKEGRPTMIFSNKSATCDWISLMLQENNVTALNLNADMPLILRMGKFKEFQEEKITILSCTDIASRGLDTKHVKQIINFDFPLYMADYIHRCGRTGRCGSPQDCQIINFVSGNREVELVQKIEMSVRTVGDLPNVNANITKIIRHKILNEEMKK